MNKSMRLALRLQRPDIWLASDSPAAANAVVPSGHARLDALLPGGGWPQGSLIGLDLAEAGTPWTNLLLPALARQLQFVPGRLALVAPPQRACLPAWQAAGIPAGRLLHLQGAAPSSSLWLAEQALACADVAGVLAFLPAASPAQWRRLRLAAGRHGSVLLFVLWQGVANASAGAGALHLKLQLDLQPPAVHGVAAGWPALKVELRRRPGLPPAAPLWLPAWGECMQALLQAGLSGLAPDHARPWQPVQPVRMPEVPYDPCRMLDRPALAG